MGFIIGGHALFFYPAESDYLLTATRFKPHILIYTSATDWVGNNTDVSLGDFVGGGGGPWKRKEGAEAGGIDFVDTIDTSGGPGGVGVVYRFGALTTPNLVCALCLLLFFFFLFWVFSFISNERVMGTGGLGGNENRNFTVCYY